MLEGKKTAPDKMKQARVGCPEVKVKVCGVRKNHEKETLVERSAREGKGNATVRGKGNLGAQRR